MTDEEQKTTRQGMMRPLIASLKGAGREPEVLRDKAMILPFGGRILGLYPQPDVNVFWVNPQLQSESTVSVILEDTGWVNSGGERAWISPEVEVHVGDPERFFDTYNVPKAMDPADYQVVERSADSATLETAVALRFLRHECDVNLKITRKVTLCEPPMELPSGVSFAGYTMDSVLSATSPLPPGVRPGLWHLKQVPGGGEFLIPVPQNASPRVCIGTPLFTQEQDLIRCDVKTSESFKFSLRANDSRGFMACLNTNGSTPTLVACKFPVLDQALYADCPCDDLCDTGHTQQIYVDDGALGGFGEMEYHSPALEAGTRERVTDRQSVWAFAGPAEALSDILERLLTETGGGWNG